MNKNFKNLINTLDPMFQRLLQQQSIGIGGICDKDNSPIGKAVYLISEGKNHLYVDWTRNLRTSLRCHCHGALFLAPLAYKITLEQLGLSEPCDSNAEKLLSEDPAFQRTFEEAKKRVANMQIRHIREDDPIKQRLFKLYVAVALETKYNSFD